MLCRAQRGDLADCPALENSLTGDVPSVAETRIVGPWCGEPTVVMGSLCLPSTSVIKAWRSVSQIAAPWGRPGDARRAKALDSAQALLSVFAKSSKPTYSFAPPEPPPLWARQTATPKRSPFQFAAWPWRHLPAPLCKWWYKAGQ